MTTTLTLKVPQEMARKLEAVAKSKRVPKSQIMREAIDALLLQEKVKPSLLDRMKNRIGCITSNEGDLSVNPKRMEGYGQ